ncbi:MAG: ATPase [Spirochaetaceae bacterium]|nr:MAG: ATPase [Spirochaetaceae bacterium]
MRTERIRKLLQILSEGLMEREEVLRLAVLALVAGENLFIYGPTGTAKSMVARRLTLLLRDARTFEYLLGRFTTPEELFGPVSIARLRDEDRYERIVEGFLPAADIVFLDEIWNASSPILNTLLTAIQERRFRNGTEELLLPLKTVIGASGSPPPEDGTLQNIWDRFLIRLETGPVEEGEAFLRLILAPRTGETPDVPDGDRITPDELDEWRDGIDAVELTGDIQEFILDVRERITRHNQMQDENLPPIVVSDRRWKQIVNMLRTSAYLNDRNRVDVFDCILMRHCLWSRPAETEMINTIIEETLFRYSTSGRFDAEAFRQRLKRTVQELRAAAYEVHQETSEEPLEYRGEYYRVLDFVEDHLTLIWIGDFQNLRTEQATETDLFFYGDGEDYAYSERFPIRLIDPVTVEIADERFSVETVRIERDRERPVLITPEARSILRNDLETLRRETESVLDEIRQYREASSSEATQHLFVHRSWAGIVATGMDQAAQEFAALQLEIDDALRELD